MLQKVPTKEIMTARAARGKYPEKYFRMVITDIVDQCDNDLGYVIYTADKKKELLQAPLDEYKGQRVALMFGPDTEPFPSFSGLVYDD